MAKKKRKTKKLVRRRSTRSKFKMLEVIVFEPSYSADWDKVGLSPGESVLFLGSIPNVQGHCAVAKHNGSVQWLVHPEDFRKASEAEL